ncbi:MAG: hypothetical protein JWP91_1432 [Fibrobacteres bacterium]|nr:hypothetical protein [Fibrobacterota bacterium]
MKPARRYAPASLLVLLFSLLILAGCREKDPFYSRNEALIRVLDAQDARSGKGADKYVIRGGNGHLFYLEDLRAAVTKWDHLDSNLALISRVSAGLKAKGVRLLLVPVPTKVEVYPALLGGRDGSDISPSKNLFLAGLDSLGVEYLDLRRDFAAARDSLRLFPHTDTHWDEDAIRLAAVRLAARLRPGLMAEGERDPESRAGSPAGLPAGTGQGSALIDSVLTGFQGDLADKFGLAETDTVRIRRVGNGKGGIYAEPDSAGILLFGDSFLNQYKRQSGHLGAHLSRELGVPVKTVHSLAGFIKGPDRILELVESLPRTRVVTWVFTSRSLMEQTF